MPHDAIDDLKESIAKLGDLAKEYEGQVTDLEKRITTAVELAVKYGGIDGDHHKLWVIDQMVRHLTGCPRETRSARDHNGLSYEYVALGESEAYKRLMAVVPSWDPGIAP